MSNTVLSAYDQLVDTASRGNDFQFDQVLFEPYPGDNQADTIFGTGFDFEEEITVPDIVDGETVQATAKLRVLVTTDGELYLRNWLIWTPTGGREHKSYASYSISPAAAAQLATAADTPSPYSDLTKEEFTELSFSEQLQTAFGMVFGAMEDSAPYKANWTQTFPGTDGDIGDDDGDMDLVSAHADYHERVIIGLGGTDSPLTCMLSDMDLGEVGPDEIVALADWVIPQIGSDLLV